MFIIYKVPQLPEISGNCGAIKWYTFQLKHWYTFELKFTYLLLGREMDNEGSLKKVWVEMVLPEGDYLACLESAQKTFHAHMAGTFLNGPAIIGKNDSYQYKEQVKAAVGYLSGIFAEFETCCDPQGGFRSQESCSFCTQKIHDFRTFMEANGFIGIEVENLEVSTYFDTTGSIRAYTSATAELAGDTINVNADVIGFLNRMDNAMDGIYGSLYYYDPMEDVICKQILEVVSADYSLPVAIQQGGVTRSSPEEVVMDITTILTVDEDGGEMVHVKVDIPLQMTNTGKTIYLQCLDNCGFNMDSIKIYLENFYSLLGKYGAQVPLLPDFPNGPYTIDSVQLIPDIQVSTQKLTKEIVQDGVVVLFGEASILINAIQDPDFYRFLAGYWGYQTSTGICRLYDNEMLIGMGQFDSPNRFVFVKNNINEYVTRFRSNSINHLGSFLAFHEAGHTAGIGHSNKGNREPLSPVEQCNGFMSDAPVLLGGYLNDSFYKKCCCFRNGLELNVTLEEVVSLGFNPEVHIDDISYIKRMIYDRFIK